MGNWPSFRVSGWKKTPLFFVVAKALREGSHISHQNCPLRLLRGAALLFAAHSPAAGNKTLPPTAELTLKAILHEQLRQTNALWCLPWQIKPAPGFPPPEARQRH